VESGISTRVLNGVNAPKAPADVADVINEDARPQPRSARPDGWAPDAPLPSTGGTRYVQPQQREVVRSAAAEQLAQVNPIKAPRR